MADVAARREARRRKILENSQNRLKLITGDQNDSTTETQDLSPKIQNNDESKSIEPAVEDLLQTMKNSIENHVHDELLSNFLSENISLPSDALLNYPAKIASSSIPEEQISNAPTTSIRSINHSKVYVVCLAIVIRLLFIFQMQFCVKDSITLPFIIFEVTMMYINRNSESSSAFLNTLLLLSNIPLSRVKLITGIVNCLEHFSTAFCIYFFTFLVVDVFLSFIL